ncbi:MAG TPA: hypothetical protein VGG42_07930 [Acidobacteriaceae bacterium]|jgi:hypothetical protein
MQATVFTEYALKDLHEAIDLIDRKIDHCRTFEVFDSQEARDGTLQKLSTRRASLVKSAQTLTAQGVKSDPKFLPRSFIHLVDGEEQGAAPAETAPEKPAAKRRVRSRATR